MKSSGENTTYIEAEDGGLFCVKSGPAVVEKAEAGGDIVILISTEAVDSDGDVIHQRRSKKGPGWVLDRFNRQPVVTWQHDIRVPNLSGPRTRAKVRKHPTKGQGLFIEPLQFDEGDEFAMILDGKIRRGVLSESSVGFKILERETRRVDDRVVGLDIYGADLIEAAIANRGANPETEVMAKRLLGRPEVAGVVEGGGSAEIEDLKAEIEHLGETVALLANELKALGDTSDGAAAEAAEQVRREAEDKQRKVHLAAGEILAALRSAGTAR